MSTGTQQRSAWTTWTTWAPLLAMVVLVASWGRHPGPLVASVIAVFLVGAVLAAVHHAEVVAHRVGEPFGSLVLAVAVTVIEVALIVTLMVTGSGDTSALARDTVFAAVMITLTGIAGLSLVVGAVKHHLAVFNPEGSGVGADDRGRAGDADAGAAALHHDHARAGVLARTAGVRRRSRR